MTRSLVFLLPRNPDIERLRSTFGVPIEVHPHVTLVYNIAVSDADALYAHIRSVLAGFGPLSLSFRGVGVSGLYVQLLVDSGRAALLQLHERLVSGLLAHARNPEMQEYVPHLTLGAFSTVLERDAAVRVATDARIVWRTVVQEVHLLQVDTEQVQVEQSFPL